MTKKLRRIFTSPPARYIRLKVRRELREYAEAGIKSNWKAQALVNEGRLL